MRTPTEILAMSILGFSCALIMLILFIIFSAAKKPSYTDLSKFALLVMIIDFSLLVIYGVNGLIKEANMASYGMRMWVFSLILSLVIVILSIAAITKVYNQILPLLILCFAMTTAIIILIITTVFFFSITSTPKELSKAGCDSRAAVWRERGGDELHNGVVWKEEASGH